MRSLDRRRFLKLGAAAPLAALLGCQDTYHFLGYDFGNKALYDLNIDTIFVHVFYSRTLQTTPYRGMERSITEEVVRQIGQKTPYHICSDRNRADTELIGCIVAITKTLMNITQQNQVREGELDVTLDVVWRDLRDGRILSAPPKRRNPNTAPPAIPAVPGVTPFVPPFDSEVSQPPDFSVTPKAEPLRLLATGRYIPELGESNATAEQQVEIKLAAQIVSMMEKRW